MRLVTHLVGELRTAYRNHGLPRGVPVAAFQGLQEFSDGLRVAGKLDAAAVLSRLGRVHCALESPLVQSPYEADYGESLTEGTPAPRQERALRYF